jgi:hypothetical protein
MEEEELKEYWEKPFSVKGYQGCLLKSFENNILL